MNRIKQVLEVLGPVSDTAEFKFFIGTKQVTKDEFEAKFMELLKSKLIEEVVHSDLLTKQLGEEKAEQIRRLERTMPPVFDKMIEENTQEILEKYKSHLAAGYFEFKHKGINLVAFDKSKSNRLNQDTLDLLNEKRIVRPRDKYGNPLGKGKDLNAMQPKRRAKYGKADK